MKPDENGCIDFNEFLRFNRGDLNDGDDERNEKRNFFLHLDKDKDGLIAFEEFKIFTNIHNDFSSLNDQQIKDLFEKIDNDKDGKITQEGNFNLKSNHKNFELKIVFRIFKSSFENKFYYEIKKNLHADGSNFFSASFFIYNYFKTLFLKIFKLYANIIHIVFNLIIYIFYTKILFVIK